jgi:hypothetical protein
MDDRSERNFWRSRHSLVMRDDPYRPLPTKSQAVATVAQVEAIRFQNPSSDGAVVDQPTIIDESERCFSASELYAAALSGIDVETPNKPKRRVGGSNDQRVQLWGAGTNGTPRRGSRTIRLFRAQPDDVFVALRAHPFGRGLQLDAQTLEVRELFGEPELHVEGQLEGAFALRSRGVGIKLRATRFNAMFTAVEIRLAERRHPYRFFVAAHDAIRSLPLPGRT